MMRLLHIFSLFAIITLSTNEYANTPCKVDSVYSSRYPVQLVDGGDVVNELKQNDTFTIIEKKEIIGGHLELTVLLYKKQENEEITFLTNEATFRQDFQLIHTIDDLQGRWATNFEGLSFTVTDTHVKLIYENSGEIVCKIQETDETFIITGIKTNWVNWVLKKKSSTLRWESTIFKKDLEWYARSIDTEEKETEKDEENIQNEDKESDADEESKIIWEGWIKDGWIANKETGLLETFHKLWFVLHSNGNLEYYYIDKNKTSKKEGEANITEDFQDYFLQGTGANGKAIILKTSKIDAHFKFETVQDALVWFEVCEQIKKEVNIREKEFLVSKETKDIDAGKYQAIHLNFKVHDPTDQVVSPEQSFDKDQIQCKITIKAIILDYMHNNNAFQTFKKISRNATRTFKIGTLCNKKKKHLKEQ